MALEKITHLTLVKITGEDTRHFLQGQLSNDINALNDGWQYSAYCNPKGRALAVFMLYEYQDAIFILLENSLKDTVLKRLKMYVMRSKVVFEEVKVNLIGAFTEAGLTELAIKQDIQAQRFGCLYQEQRHLLNFGGRCLVVDFSNTFNAPTGESWVQMDIAEALPRVTLSSSEMFVPQMLNLDLLNGISFKKGCYTGQEIIARMRYLGKLKQRSFVCELETAGVVSIGDKITNTQGKSIGNIANCTQDSLLITAVLRFDNLEELVHESAGSINILEPQPYDMSSD